jgi:phospholipid/cholesterol/gamma-HCH transport system substrate-binding protein
MDERRLELKVGALVLGAIAGVLGLLWALGELSVGSQGLLLVDFAHTGNVVAGAPVKLGGIAVGKVEGVKLFPDRRDAQGRPLPVQMRLDVDGATLAALGADTTVTVSSQGPLGESYLELNPGGAPGSLRPSEALRGVDAPRLDVVSAQLASFLGAFTQVLQDDPQAFSDLVRGLSEISSSGAAVLRENRSEVRTVFTELAGAAQDLRLIADLLRKALAPGGKGSQLLDDGAELVRGLKQTAPGLSKDAAKALAGLAAVTQYLTPVDGKRLQAMLARLAEVSARADRILARLEAGEGTLGALHKDRQVYDDLRALLEDIRKHPWKLLWKD